MRSTACRSLLTICVLFTCWKTGQGQRLFPENDGSDVNPDTHLEITFDAVPVLGTSGKIKVYDTSDNTLVDVLDLSIPAGPTERTTAPKPPYISSPYVYTSGNFTNANTKPGTPSGGAEPTSDTFQLTIIGGFTDGFHFYPVIIHDRTATISLHHQLLQYGKTYSVEIDPEVFTVDNQPFGEFAQRGNWIFSTKAEAPSPDQDLYVVSSDGSGDFNTVQGAMDFIPDFNTKRITVLIKNGLYEEIVYFRNKTNVTLVGETRDGVIIQYANKEAFNPHPVNIATNEVPGTYPSRRAAFAADNCQGIHLINMTIRSTCTRAQAEGLLLNGSENIVYNVSVGGSGDSLQSNGSAYYYNSSVDGWGDLILGRGPAYFQNCSFSAFGPYMWIRNTDANHGNVFNHCNFMTPDDKETVIARCPTNNGKDYPYTEAVLLECRLKGIAPEGWGDIGAPEHAHYWEYRSMTPDGQPVDVAMRHPDSKQLTWEQDSVLIKSYRKPDFVLGGWTPEMAPIILAQPESTSATRGMPVSLQVLAAAVPSPSYQWYRNGKAVEGATSPTLDIDHIRPEEAGMYSVRVENAVGSAASTIAHVAIQ